MNYGTPVEPTIISQIGTVLLDNAPVLLVAALLGIHWLIGYVERKKQEELMSEDISQAWVDAVWRGYAKYNSAKPYKRGLNDTSK